MGQLNSRHRICHHLYCHRTALIFRNLIYLHRALTFPLRIYPLQMSDQQIERMLKHSLKRTLLKMFALRDVADVRRF